MDILGSVTTFYGSQHTPTKTGNYFWKCQEEIESKIVKGEVDSIRGVYHLPLHWVSVVFDFQQECILYGDSIGQPIPNPEHKAFTRWIKCLYQRSGRSIDNNPIPVHPLPTGCQRDTASCGLFALNPIGHHYIGHPLLPSDHTSLAYRQTEIALDIIYENTVCFCLFNL